MHRLDEQVAWQEMGTELDQESKIWRKIGFGADSESKSSDSESIFSDSTHLCCLLTERKTKQSKTLFSFCSFE